MAQLHVQGFAASALESGAETASERAFERPPWRKLEPSQAVCLHEAGRRMPRERPSPLHVRIQRALQGSGGLRRPLSRSAPTSTILKKTSVVQHAGLASTFAFTPQILVVGHLAVCVDGGGAGRRGRPAATSWSIGARRGSAASGSSCSPPPPTRTTRRCLRPPRPCRHAAGRGVGAQGREHLALFSWLASNLLGAWRVSRGAPRPARLARQCSGATLSRRALMYCGWWAILIYA